MEDFHVSVSHDFYTRKPINISFSVQLINSEGLVLYSINFKRRNFNEGQRIAWNKRRWLEDPITQAGLAAAAISESIGFKIDYTGTFDDFMKDIFRHASVEYLEEFLKRTTHPVDIEFIKEELNKRGVLA